MKILTGTQLKLGLLLPIFFVIVLGIVSYIQSNKHYKKTETLYSNALILERSINMLKSSIISLHRDMKDISIDSTEKEIDTELLWIKWWQLRASGQIDTIYREYTGPRNDIDSLSLDYAVLNNECEKTIELMRSGKRSEVLNRTKTYGIISEIVQKLLAEIDEINIITIKNDDELYMNLVQMGNTFNKKMLLLVILIFLFSLVINFVLTRTFTERKLTEEKVKESELKYRALFETSSDAILLFTEFAWDDCNAGALRVFGCTREQIIGANPSRFSPPMQPDGRSSEEEAIKLITLAYEGKPQFFEWEHCRADATPFAAEVSLNRLDLRGRPYIQAIVRDVSERKKAEIKVSEQLEELSRWHDITSDREEKILEIKREVNELLIQAGKPPRYESAT